MRRLLALTVVVALAAAWLAAAAARGQRPTGYCSDSQFPAKRDRSNPLMLANPPGSNPINGANFFVDGPRHGMAAGAIAKLLGMNPQSFPDDESWSDFDTFVVPQGLLTHPGQAHNVHMLEKIASQPEPQRISEFSAGGGPGAIYDQTHKILCNNLSADPGTIPILQSYFIFPQGKYCASYGEIARNGRTFRRQVKEMAHGIGRKPVVVLTDLDSVVTSYCLKGRARKLWVADLRFEVNQFARLPHTVVYAEAGYSDADTARFTAKILNKIGIRKIRGFYTNDTHLNWTINEIRWGRKVSRLTHGAHFIVNTAQNGQGPKLNPHPGKQGIEDLCNPPGRGLGPRDTTHTGFSPVDALLWTHVPGRSSGKCHGGPPSGEFFVARAIGLAERANERLGPGYPSRPY